MPSVWLFPMDKKYWQFRETANISAIFRLHFAIAVDLKLICLLNLERKLDQIVMEK
jgi:hypothetical protein